MSIDIAPPELDRELAQRLERLAARRAPSSPPNGPRSSNGPRSASGPARRGRRHAAKGSRIAALALSLGTTAGLSAGFAATDGPSSSVLTAAGGVVDVQPSAAATVGSDTGGSQAAATTAAATTATPATPAAVTVVNGDALSNRWGPVQVQVTFAADGSISAVDAIQVPFRDGRSVWINDQAVPRLNSAALTAQSSQVDTVSGATYTSTDYKRSLQSAIDAARAAGITQLA